MMMSTSILATTEHAEFVRQLSERPVTWSVWRQDDNGNQAIVATGLSKAAADEMAKTYEDKGHKQLYWTAEEKKS